MKVSKTNIPEVFILEPFIYSDHRGWFMETWSEEKGRELGLDLHFVQDNHSQTLQKGTIRGFHFQNNPLAQYKIVRVIKGIILDVVVDLRQGSPTYLYSEGIELSEENKRQLCIPRGFAHGFLTLSDNVEVVYKVDNPYSPALDRSIRFDDPDIHFNWGINQPILSPKDQNAPLLKNSDCNFIYEVIK